MPQPYRYLVQFNPKQTPHFFTDILVIGAGIAGLRAALDIPKEIDVLVVGSRLTSDGGVWVRGRHPVSPFRLRTCPILPEHRS